MQKYEILNALNYAKGQLSSFQKQRAELAAKYETICEFSRQCTSHINSFRNSMDNRKRRLKNIEGLIKTVKAATNYKKKMGDALTGNAYMEVSDNIDSLEKTLAKEKGKIVSDMQYVDGQINYYQSQVKNLQYQYDTYVEEDK